MKKLILICFLTFLIIFCYLILKNKSYEVKINIKFGGLNAQKIDENIAEILKDKLLEIEELDEILIISKENSCSIYCKIKNHILNKEQVTDKIKRKLSVLDNFKNDFQVTFDDKFNSINQIFFVVYSDIVDFDTLKNYSDKIIDEILGLKISSKVSEGIKTEKCTYVYYKDSTLLKYNLSLEDIKNSIRKNNILEDFIIKTGENNSLKIKTNGSYTNANDIKNNYIPYKNKNFSWGFGDVFEIEEGIKKPSSGYIFLDNKKAQIIAVSKKKFYPDFLFHIKINNLKKKLDKTLPPYISTKIFNTFYLKKIELYFNKNTIFSTLSQYEKISSNLGGKNILYFIGFDIPKINHGKNIQEQQKNKITILTYPKNYSLTKNTLDELGIIYITKPTVKILEDYDKNKLLEKVSDYIFQNNTKTIINNSFYKTTQIESHIDETSLADYGIDKKDVINTVFANGDGLVCDYYFDRAVKIPIILKNKEEGGFIFSKSQNSLISTQNIIKDEPKEVFCTITRKDEKYRAILIIK